jgi:hypothetical protein
MVHPVWFCNGRNSPVGGRACVVLFMLYDNNNNNLLTANGLSPGGSGYFTFKLRQTY